MSVVALRAKARKHWEEWLPERTRELKELNNFQYATTRAAKDAQTLILKLMQQGYQEHEAEEVALPRYILLPPEDDARVDAELQAELDEMEAEYQSWARPMSRLVE